MKEKPVQMAGVNPSIFNHYKTLRILVIGDVMLDHYIQADVERTSPEAPVIIAAVQSERYVAGGAANVAANLRAMGAAVLMAGLTGKDENGAQLRSILQEKNISTALLFPEAGRPTTLKTRIMARGQQILRIDREVKNPPSPNFLKKITAFLNKKSNRLDGVIISDYAKGLCSKELLQPIFKILKQRRIPVLCDPKGKDFAKYRGVNVITPNLREAQDASDIPIADNASLERAAKFILKKTAANNVVITRGADGVSLFGLNQDPVHISAHAREVYDVTGAGDTFISHFALAYFSGMPPHKAAELGNYASAITVGKLGVVVVKPDELASFIRSETFGSKSKSLDEMVEIVKHLKSSGKKVVFTNGCFDLIHIGHIKFLQAARALGDCLIVGINTDASVRKVKGPGRPLIGENERADFLSSLHWVDYVVLFDEATPEPMLRALMPDVLVKGKNHKPDEVVGAEIVKGSGGTIHRLPLFSNISTSEIFDMIKNQTRK